MKATGEFARAFFGGVADHRGLIQTLLIFAEPCRRYVAQSDVRSASDHKDIVAQRRSLAARLTARLATVHGLSAQAEPSGRVHAYQSYVVLLDPDIDRDGVVESLKEHGVESTIGTYALHMEPVFQRLGYHDDDLPGAVSSPNIRSRFHFFSGMSDAELDQVVAAVEDVVHKG